jgi:hypothetical protein
MDPEGATGPEFPGEAAGAGKAGGVVPFWAQALLTLVSRKAAKTNAFDFAALRGLPLPLFLSTDLTSLLDSTPADHLPR